MKKLISLMLLMFASFQMFAQGTPEKNQPDQQIKVNKEYDENGKLIRYDSSCVRSWSSDSTFANMDMDSVREMMKLYFSSGMDSFFPDSTLTGGNFFHDFDEDFFQKNLRQLDHSGLSYNDSTLDSIHGLTDPFEDLEQLHREMMSRFQEFFKEDSLDSFFNDLQGNRLTSPDEDDIDLLRRKLKQYFNQLNTKKPVL